MTETQRNFIRNLKRFRKQLGLSQMKLAELCGISTSYVGEIEIGRKYPSVETFQRIANALHIEPHKLLMSDMSLADYNQNDLILLLSENMKRSVNEAIDCLVKKYIVDDEDLPIVAEKANPEYSE